MSRAWLLDCLLGHFLNGVELEEVPRPLHSFYSAQGYLQRKLNNTLDDDPNNPLFYGKLLFFDTYVEVPLNVKEIGKALSDYIKYSGSWVKDVKVAGWHLNRKGAFLECVVFCIQHDKDVFKFKVKLVARGAIVVETWSGARLG